MRTVAISFESPLSTGTVDYRSDTYPALAGLNPSAAIFVATGVPATFSTVFNLRMSVGVAARRPSTGAITQRAYGVGSLDNISVSNTDRVSDEAVVLVVEPSNPAPPPFSALIEIEGVLTAWHADGFTLDWIDVGSSARGVFVLLIGGDIDDAIVTTHLSPNGTTGPQAYTGVGFEADFAFAVHAGGIASTTAVPANAATLSIGIGAATEDDQWSICAISNNNEGTSITDRGGRSDAIISVPSNGGNILRAATLDTFDADGFTLDWFLNSAGQQPFTMLLLKGGAIEVGLTTKPSSADLSYAGAAVPPTGMLLAHVCGIAIGSATALSANARYAIGIVDESDVQYGACWTDRDNQSTTSVQSRQDDSAWIITTNADTGDILQLGTIGLDATGFDLALSPNTADAIPLGYVLFGPADVPPVAVATSLLMVG